MRPYEAFLRAFAPVIQQFGADKFPTSALAVINDRTQDLTDVEFQALTRLIFEKCEYPPKPATVLEHAQSIRNRRVIQFDQIIQPYQEKCDECRDLGVVRAISRKDPSETLMRCDCEAGRTCEYALPIWTSAFSKTFERQFCPVTWFKPELPLQKPIGLSDIQSLVQGGEYRKRLRAAEEYWARASARRNRAKN